MLIERLLRQRDEIEKQLQNLQKGATKIAEKAIRDAQALGVNAQQLASLITQIATPERGRRGRKPLGDSAPPVRRRGGVRGVKIAPKYRHPDSGETWTGRGMMPKWMQAEVAKGSTRDDFLIQKPAAARATKS